MDLKAVRVTERVGNCVFIGPPFTRGLIRIVYKYIINTCFAYVAKGRLKHAAHLLRPYIDVQDEEQKKGRLCAV